MPDSKTEAAQPPEGFSVSHAIDTPFVAQGLRAFFEYRDLGIRDATQGRFGAHVIRVRPGSDAAPQWHCHSLKFQMVYVTRGWVEFEYEGVGKVRLEPGSCVHQPPGIRHRELAHSDDMELIEITLPADFGTTALEKPVPA
jgi:quercetin dioxygenase-like cupin family protein